MDIKKQNAGDIFLLFIVSLIWGSQFIFNKMALKSFTPIEIAMLRSIIGTLTLSLIWFIIRSPCERSAMRIHGLFFCVALFETTIPFLLIPWGQQFIDSAVAALLVGMIPIFVAVINLCLGQRVSFPTFLSIGIGFVGVMILLLPGLHGVSFFSNTIGDLAVLGGAFSFAISIFLIKKLPPMPAILSCRNILCWAMLQLLPFFILKYSHLSETSSLSAWFSVIMLGIFCAGIVYVCYVLLVNRAGTMMASFANYLVPFIGFLLGIIFFKETIHLNFMIALALIFVALFFGLYQKKGDLQ